MPGLSVSAPALTAARRRGSPRPAVPVVLVAPRSAWVLLLVLAAAVGFFFNQNRMVSRRSVDLG